MYKPADIRTNLLRAVVFLIAYLVLTGWGLSLLDSLKWVGLCGSLGLVVTFILARRWAGPVTGWLNSLAEPMTFWPFILLGAVILIGAAIYPITTLDSLSYRVPRILLWLQEGRIYDIPTANSRMNYMPHLWELVSMPLMQVLGVKLAYFWSFVGWVVVYLVGYDWALEFCGDVNKSKKLAFLGATSAFAVIQAASAANDVFAVALILLTVRFILTFEKTRDGREIVWAVFACCMAADVKPHFAVLGLPLSIWFAFSPSKPWKIFRWAWLPVLLPLWLACSPASSFAWNYQHYGFWSGPPESSQELLGGENSDPVWNVGLGTVLVIWQAIQPPINPAAMAWKKPLDAFVKNHGLNKHVSRFRLAMFPLNIVDSASLGLLTAILFAGGIFLAFKRDPHVMKSWPGWVMVAGLGSMLLALSVYVAWSSGRIYCGFLYLLLPLAMLGWSSFRAGTLRLMIYLCLFNSLFVLILNPARPLWPVGQAQQMLAHSSRFSWLADQLNRYALFTDRARTGVDILWSIPDDGSDVVVLVADDRPLLPLFYFRASKHRLITLTSHATVEELNAAPGNYVILSGGLNESYPELSSYLNTSTNYTLVCSHEYTPALTRGVETWKLYRRVSAKPAVPSTP